MYNAPLLWLDCNLALWSVTLLGYTEFSALIARLGAFLTEIYLSFPSAVSVDDRTGLIFVADGTVQNFTVLFFPMESEIFTFSLEVAVSTGLCRGDGSQCNGRGC